MLRRIVLVAILLLIIYSSTTRAESIFKEPEPYKGTWYNIPLHSKHTNTETEHNERNWGFGVEKHVFGRNWLIGTYRNSEWKNSSYVMTELTFIDISDRIRLRFNAGLVTGYRLPITPGILPVWTYDGGKWGFDAITIPSIGGSMGIYALQAKVKF